MFNKKGLNSEERKAIAQLEREQRDSQKRLNEALPQFKKEYTSLVNYHRIRHNAVIGFVEGTPDWVRRMVLGVAKPIMQLIECSEEVDRLNSQALQEEINRNKNRNQAVDPEGN